MFYGLILLFSGSGTGYIFRRVELLHKVEKTISLTIFCMLFTFGVTIGSNDELISNLDKFGYQAALLAILGTAGSLCASYLAYRLIFRKGGKDEK